MTNVSGAGVSARETYVDVQTPSFKLCPEKEILVYKALEQYFGGKKLSNLLDIDS